MNGNQMRRWMDAVDEKLLEEAQRPPVRGTSMRRWGAAAACLCAAALVLALWQPWSGTKADGGGQVFSDDTSGAQPLRATLVLPEGAELTDSVTEDASSAKCTVLLDGYDYDYTAVYTAEVLPAPDGKLPETAWQVGGLTLLLYEDGSVGWYDSGAGIQWYCVAWDGGQPLVTAFAMMDAQSYTVPTAPAGAETLGYDLLESDGTTVTEVTFALEDRTWHYRMAATYDVSETIPDISGYSGGRSQAQSTVRWCPALLRWDEGGAGCIRWKDVAPGLVYSLTVDSGASEDVLAETAAAVFQPAQEES